MITITPYHESQDGSKKSLLTMPDDYLYNSFKLKISILEGRMKKQKLVSSSQRNDFAITVYSQLSKYLVEYAQRFHLNDSNEWKDLILRYKILVFRDEYKMQHKLKYSKAFSVQQAFDKFSREFDLLLKPPTLFELKTDSVSRW